LALLALTYGVQAGETAFRFEMEDGESGKGNVDPGDIITFRVKVSNDNNNSRDFELIILNASELSGEPGLMVWWTNDGIGYIGGMPYGIHITLVNESTRNNITLALEAADDTLYGWWNIDLRCRDLDDDNPSATEKLLSLSVHVNEKANVTVSVAGNTTGSVDIGEETIYQLEIQNTGNRPDIFDLSVGGNNWNVSLDNETNYLEVYDRYCLIIIITSPNDAWYGDNDTIYIIITSRRDSNASSELELTTYVRVYQSIIFEAYSNASKNGTQGQIVNFTFYVFNKWSETIIYNINVTNVQNNWTFQIGDIDHVRAFGFQSVNVSIEIPLNASIGNIETFIVRAWVGNRDPVEVNVAIKVIDNKFSDDNGENGILSGFSISMLISILIITNLRLRRLIK